MLDLAAAGSFLVKHWKGMVMGGLAFALIREGQHVYRLNGELAVARAAQFVPGADGRPTKVTWRAKAEADARDLGTCSANAGVLQSAIDRQNASLDAAAAEGRQRAADAEKAVSAARTATQRAERQARAVLDHQPAGPDTCARVSDVDRQFMEQIR